MTLAYALFRLVGPWYEQSVYGELHHDPVVTYYDLAFGITGSDEHEFYATRIDQYGGPLLDLGGGSGRFTVEAASRGHDVTYVDASPGMHAVVSEKLGDLPDSIRSRVELLRCDMADFNADSRYSLVLCVDAFFHNLTSSKARATLNRICRALQPEGVLAFNVHHTTPTFLCFAASDEGSSWNLRGRYAISETGRTLQVEQAFDIDYSTQVITTRLRFREIDEQDGVVNERFSEWQSRYFNRFELEYLIELCGLEIVSVAGDYRGGPVTEGSQLIYECRTRHR